MNINGFGPGVVNVPHGGKPHGKDAVQDPQPAGATTGPEQSAGDPAPQEVGGPRAQGVVRLLQEGHFRGVADVRLRINFADDIAQIEQNDLAETVEAELPAVQGSVNDALDALVASGELDDEQTASVLAAAEAFNAAVNDAADAFAAGSGNGTEGLIGAIETAFSELVESLSPIVTAFVADEDGVPVASPAEGEEDGAATIDAPETATSTFVSDLQATFDSALAEFQSALAGSSALPDLSEPSGNGAAFEKFLAILNEVNGTDTGQSDPVNTIA